MEERLFYIIIIINFESLMHLKSEWNLQRHLITQKERIINIFSLMNCKLILWCHKKRMVRSGCENNAALQWSISWSVYRYVHRRQTRTFVSTNLNDFTVNNIITWTINRPNPIGHTPKIAESLNLDIDPLSLILTGL